jgi:type I restriction enzyme S subunit
VNQDKYDPSFVYYLLKTKTDVIQSVANSATTPIVNKSTFASINVCVPPLPTQRAIATFLDRKTGQIDELIRIKEQQTELLQEQRTALINQVVTKGLDPNVEMKPSGMEWIGDIPAHWEVINTKYLFQLVTEPAPENNDYELLSIYTSIGVRPRKELEERGNRATTTDGYWLVKKGDFIVNKLLAWMGAIGLSNYEGVTSPAYDILRKIRPLNERFYEYLFRCGLYFIEFKKRSRGIMEVRLRLYFDQFGQIPLVFPPVHEQDKITNFLDGKTQQIDELIATEQRKIELLKEYRQSLISEAVTGKIDVRNEV